MGEQPCVSFLVAGVQKGGTTALHDYLSEHPSLLLPSVKEAHFFDDESLDWSCPDYGRYHARFAPPPNGDRLWGEATPIYIYWPNCLKRIAAYNPAMKLILIFRDPVERAWSHWKMEYARGAEKQPFAWAIREGRARVFDDPSAPGHHREFSYVERGFYGAQVRTLLEIFPRDQVLFLKSRDLRTNPEQILGSVCDFLNAPRLVKIEKKESHVSRNMDYGKSISHDDRRYLTKLFLADQEIFSETTGLHFESEEAL